MKFTATIEEALHLTPDEMTCVKVIRDTIQNPAKCDSMESALRWLSTFGGWFVYRGGGHLALHKASGDSRRIMLVVEAKDNTYADQTLKAGDLVGVRSHTDITPGTVVAVKGRKATVRLHNFTLVNKPGSGHPEAMECHPGGFAAHWSGRQINKVDFDSDAGTVVITLRKPVVGKMDNQGKPLGQFWKRSGYAPKGWEGIVYTWPNASYDYNF